MPGRGCLRGLCSLRGDPSLAELSGNTVLLKGDGRVVITAAVRLDGVRKSDEVVIYSGITCAEWRKKQQG